MLGNKQGCMRMEGVPDYVLFDLETTGTSWERDAVVEISAIKVRGGKPVEEFSQLVNPGMAISYAASEVNGITDEMVADCPSFDIVLEEFLRFAGDDVLVGHNIKMFDLKFIQKSAQRYFGKMVGNDYVDTLPLSKIYLPELGGHTLGDLASHYGISTDGAHRALNDCRMNQQVFECLKREMENPSEAAKKVERCPRCGNLLKRRSGRYGEFWGCMSYPDCKFTRNIPSNGVWME